MSGGIEVSPRRLQIGNLQINRVESQQIPLLCFGIHMYPLYLLSQDSHSTSLLPSALYTSSTEIEMVIFSIPCTSCSLPFKFHTNKTQLVCRASITSFAAANPPTLTDNTTLFCGDLSLRTSWPPRMFSDQVLIKENDDGLKINRSSSEEGFEKEVSNVITRLNTVVERMREMEMQKFMSRVKGEVICDRILAEKMSGDIFIKFLEKPLQYLSSEEGDLQEKLRHVNFLVRVLEKSCTEAPN